MVELGEKRAEVISATGMVKTGHVVYIHPQHRFYTVEFDCGKGRKMRESYIMGKEFVNAERLCSSLD